MHGEGALAALSSVQALHRNQHDMKPHATNDERVESLYPFPTGVIPDRATVVPIKDEKDPHGRDPHTSGAKLDAGKVRPGLVLGGFARALWAVSEIGTFGAAKYTDNGWIEVPNGEARYDDAKLRHWLKDKMGQITDPDSQKTHLAHEAWNALARLDLYLREQETK